MSIMPGEKKYSTYSETAEPMIYLYLFINIFFIYLFIHSLACAFNKLEKMNGIRHFLDR